MDIDLDRLKVAIADYFDSDLSHEEIAYRHPSAMRNSSAFKISDARVRDALLARGGPRETGFIPDYAYRPFDNRWLYWESDRRLLTAPAPDYWPHVFPKGTCGCLPLSIYARGRLEPQACTHERQKRRLIAPNRAWGPCSQLGCVT